MIPYKLTQGPKDSKTPMVDFFEKTVRELIHWSPPAVRLG